MSKALPLSAARTTSNWPSRNRDSPRRRSAAPSVSTPGGIAECPSSHRASRTPHLSINRLDRPAWRDGWWAAWHPSQSVTRFAGSSEPPSDLGIRWWMSASLGSHTSPQDTQRYWSLSRTRRLVSFQLALWPFESRSIGPTDAVCCFSNLRQYMLVAGNSDHPLLIQASRDPLDE